MFLYSYLVWCFSNTRDLLIASSIGLKAAADVRIKLFVYILFEWLTYYLRLYAHLDLSASNFVLPTNVRCSDPFIGVGYVPYR